MTGIRSSIVWPLFGTRISLITRVLALAVLFFNVGSAHAAAASDDDRALVCAALEDYCTSMRSLECRYRRTYTDAEHQGEVSEEYLVMKETKLFFEYCTLRDPRYKRAFWFYDGRRKTAVTELTTSTTVGFSEFDEEWYYNEYPMWFAGMYLRARKRVPVYEQLRSDSDCEVVSTPTGEFVFSIHYDFDREKKYFEQFTYTVDPTKGFLPKSIAIDVPVGKAREVKRLSTWQIVECRQVPDEGDGGHRWFPTKIVGTGELGGRWQSIYEMLEVKINAPIPDSFFSYSIPDGAQVIDEQKNETYIQGGFGALQEQLDATATEAVAFSRGGVELDATPRFYSTWLGAASATICTVAILLLLLRRGLQK